MTATTDVRPAGDDDLAPVPTLAVVYDVSSSSPLDLVELLGGHCNIVWVVEAADPSLGSWARLLPRLGSVVDIAGQDAESVARQLRQIEVDGIVAFADSQLMMAARLSEELGVQGNSPQVVVALTDKVVQRTILRDAGIPGPAFVAIAAGTECAEVPRLLDGMRFPVVLKPQSGTGSRDTAKADDLAAALEYLREIEESEGLGVDLIVEEWLWDLVQAEASPFASYVSVEAVAHRGHIVPLAVTGKFPLAPPCRETGNFLPHHLSVDEADAMRCLAVQAAEALGVTSGALHIEIKMTPDGPRIIEVNGRIGGGAIDTLFAIRHGRSLTEIAAAVAMGEPVDLDSFDVEGCEGPFAYAFFVQPPVEARVLTALDNLEAIIEEVGVHTARVNRTVGDKLHWRDGSQGYLLLVQGSAEDLEALSQVPEWVLSQLTVGWS